jgi:Asp/Glu/hydantoin racemase
MSADLPSGVRVGLLHTVPSLADTFHTSLADSAPGIDLVHVVDPALLRTAIQTGVTETVFRDVAAHVRHLRDSGAVAVLVTCSSIGEAVEAAAELVPIPVLRVDAPMAQEAVDLAAAAGQRAGRAGRIRVLATLAATLGPTGRLIERYAQGRGIEVSTEVVAGAIEARDAGDRDEHDRLIAAAVTRSRDADAVVLAQASMAHATRHLSIGIPILTSPQSGVDALLKTVKGLG